LIRFAVNSGATAPITHDRQEPLQQPVSIESSVKFPQRVEAVQDFGAGAYSFSPGIGWVGAKTLQFRARAREGLSDRRRA
jgi:hypothetical protein